MGLGIEYRIRLGNRRDATAFLAAARAVAKKLGWKATRPSKTASVAELLPHPKCEPIHLDFSKSLSCTGYVKTSFAPERVHIQVVHFLRALMPHVKSMKVDDECEYWSTEDKITLRRHRSALGKAQDTLRGAPGSYVDQITHGAIIAEYNPSGQTVVRILPGTNIGAKQVTAMRREGFVVKIERAK